MTRTDLLMAVIKETDCASPADRDWGKTCLIGKMHQKIENVYEILFGLEKVEEFKELGALLRKALET